MPEVDWSATWKECSCASSSLAKLQRIRFAEFCASCAGAAAACRAHGGQARDAPGGSLPASSSHHPTVAFGESALGGRQPLRLGARRIVGAAAARPGARDATSTTRAGGDLSRPRHAFCRASSQPLSVAVIGDLACGEFPTTLGRLTKFSVHPVCVQYRSSDPC